jgi:hypothetical protein
MNALQSIAMPVSLRTICPPFLCDFSGLDYKYKKKISKTVGITAQILRFKKQRFTTSAVKHKKKIPKTVGMRKIPKTVGILPKTVGIFLKLWE